MSEITAAQVKALREATGAGMMDCKNALVETDGDFERAVDLLREKGLAQVAKRAGRSADQGLIDSYIHFNNTVGVLVEVNCETDFVANTDEFRQLVKDIALHIASPAAPRFLVREEFPADELERERHIFEVQAKESGKPEQVIEKIVEGKLNALFKDTRPAGAGFREGRLQDRAAAPGRGIGQARRESCGSALRPVQAWRMSRAGRMPSRGVRAERHGGGRAHDGIRRVDATHVRTGSC